MEWREWISGSGEWNEWLSECGESGYLRVERVDKRKLRDRMLGNEEAKYQIVEGLDARK